MPFNPFSEASFSALLTSSTVVFFSTNAARSTTETFGVGTRMAKPSSFPFSSGITNCSGPGAAQVFVRKIQDHLIVSVRVDSGHRSALDFEIVMNHFGHRRQAIGGAGSVGDNVVLAGIVLIFINSENDGNILIFSRGGDDDFFYRSAKMLFGVGRIRKPACGFNHHLRAN